MAFEYNESYLKTFKRYRDIMNTDIIVILSKTGSQSEDPIFKLRAIPKKRVFFDGETEIHTSEILFFTDELEELRSYNLNESVKFPLRDIKNRVKIIRFDGVTYYVTSKDVNFFNNILKFTLQSNI